jgi:uncharacterized membrane protein/ribosomal protein L40E
VFVRGWFWVTFESNRLLGGVGALLMVVSSISSFLSLAEFFVPSLTFGVVGAPFGLLGIVGLIIFMIAMNGLANDYKDRGIFDNALYWIITGIVGGVVTAVFAVAIAFSVLSSVIGTLVPLTPGNTPTLSSVLDAFQPYIGYFIPVGIVAFAIGVVSVLFIMRAFNRLAAASGVSMFRTVALLFLAGIALTGAIGLLAALLIVTGSVAVGAILPFIAIAGLVNLAEWALATAAFFRLKAPASSPVPQTAPQAVAPAPTAPAQVKYCRKCGAENRMDAAFCVRCGEKLQA